MSASYKNTDAGIDYQKAAADGYSDLLEKLQDYMKEELSDDYTEEGRTHVAIKFRYKTIQVDLLLSPYWETMDSYLRDIRTIQPPFKRLT